MKLLILLWTYMKIAALTVGGGMAMVPIIQDAMVRHDWMTDAEFLQIFGISEATPGPLAVNTATFVGWRVAGIAGMSAATIGLLLPAFVFVMLLSKVWKRFENHPAAARAMTAMKAVLAALILGVAFRFAAALISNPEAPLGIAHYAVGVTIAALVFFTKLSPIVLLLGGAILAAAI